MCIKTLSGDPPAISFFTYLLYFEGEGTHRQGKIPPFMHCVFDSCSSFAELLICNYVLLQDVDRTKKK